MLLIECKYTPNAIAVWAVDSVFANDFWPLFSFLFLFRRLSTRDRTRTRKCVAYFWPTKSCAGEIRRRSIYLVGFISFLSIVAAFRHVVQVANKITLSLCIRMQMVNLTHWMLVNHMNSLLILKMKWRAVDCDTHNNNITAMESEQWFYSGWWRWRARRAATRVVVM